jgi:hypothetical protein
MEKHKKKRIRKTKKIRGGKNKKRIISLSRKRERSLKEN